MMSKNRQYLIVSKVGMIWNDREQYLKDPNLDVELRILWILLSRGISNRQGMHRDAQKFITRILPLNSDS